MVELLGMGISFDSGKWELQSFEAVSSSNVKWLIIWVFILISKLIEFIHNILIQWMFWEGKNLKAKIH
jgi:hypothetical protein